MTFSTPRRRVSGLLFCLTLAAASGTVLAGTAAAEAVKVGVFDVDASPPVGAPLAYDPCIEITDPLSCRGIVLTGAGKPIVVAAIDWLGVANEAHEVVRKKIAAAVGTDAERVAFHALHQHDAPRCDFSAAQLLAHHGDRHPHYDVPWARDVFDRIAAAAREAAETAVPVDEVGFGVAEVFEVASNRRLLNEQGRVFATRYTACRDPKLRAMPTGTIDPMLRLVSFWNQGVPVAVLTYYATHPQSYYRTGQANPDFPGYARNLREEQTGIPHVHFNGAGGNIGAGKWNDGSRENRQILAERVADGMKRAWENVKRFPLTASDVAWRSVPVSLPVGKHLDEAALVATLEDHSAASTEKLTAAKHLAWLRRTAAGETIDVQGLKLGKGSILHLPGELFVEYQLAAAAMKPGNFVAMAAYGEYGPGYIGTEVAYSQGGYETSGRASRVAPETEPVLLDAVRTLLSP